MGITLYQPANIDMTNPSTNGGAISNAVIEDGVLNNLFPDILAIALEFGDERWVKFFLKTTTDLSVLGICLGLSSFDNGDLVYLASGGATETEADLDKANMRFYGAFNVSNYDAANKKVTADRDVSEFVKIDDLVTFYDSDSNRVIAYEVQNINSNEIIFKNVNSEVDISNCSGHSTIFYEALTANTELGFWIKEVIEPYILPNDISVFFNCLIWYE